MHQLNLESDKKITINMKLCINPSFLLFVSKDPLFIYKGVEDKPIHTIAVIKFATCKGRTNKRLAYLV